MKNRILLVAVLAFLVGCSSANNEDTLANLNSRNIQRLANLYFSFQSSHDWIGPEDEAEFKEYIKNFPQRKLDRIGVDPSAVDDLFINERDGEPFTIRWAVVGNMMGCSKPVIFETAGVNGRKMVAFLDMVQREVEDDEYELLLSGQIETSEPTRRN